MSLCLFVMNLKIKMDFVLQKKGGGAANSINEETITVFLFALNCTVRITLMFWEMIIFQIKPWDPSLNSVFCSCRIHFTMSPWCTVPKPWGIDVTPLDERCLGCEHRGLKKQSVKEQSSSVPLLSLQALYEGICIKAWLVHSVSVYCCYDKF